MVWLHRKLAGTMLATEAILSKLNVFRHFRCNDKIHFTSQFWSALGTWYVRTCVMVHHDLDRALSVYKSYNVWVRTFLCIPWVDLFTWQLGQLTRGKVHNCDQLVGSQILRTLYSVINKHVQESALYHFTFDIFMNLMLPQCFNCFHLFILLLGQHHIPKPSQLCVFPIVFLPGAAHYYQLQVPRLSMDEHAQQLMSIHGK